MSTKTGKEMQKTAKKRVEEINECVAAARRRRRRVRGRA
jgi:hypothetical protein